MGGGPNQVANRSQAQPQITFQEFLASASTTKSATLKSVRLPH